MTKEQLTLDFEPGLSEQYGSALEVVRAGAYTRPLKGLAADMDLSQSELSRKLAQNEHDPRRFTLDDFERYLSASGDMRPLEYLIERYLANESDKQRRGHGPGGRAAAEVRGADEAGRGGVMADVIDLANDRAELDTARALEAARKPRGPMIWPQLVCHNCGEPLADANALFCDHVEPGENRPACAIDFWRRHAR